MIIYIHLHRRRDESPGRGPGSPGPDRQPPAEERGLPPGAPDPHRRRRHPRRHGAPPPAQEPRRGPVAARRQHAPLRHRLRRRCHGRNRARGREEELAMGRNHSAREKRSESKIGEAAKESGRLLKRRPTDKSKPEREKIAAAFLFSPFQFNRPVNYLPTDCSQPSDGPASLPLAATWTASSRIFSPAGRRGLRNSEMDIFFV